MIKKTLVAWVSALAATMGAAAEKPNILVIYVDDVGYNDIGCYGAKDRSIETPHIDQLAEEGVRFTNWISPSAVCSPSRAALLTERYQDGHDDGKYFLGDAESFTPNAWGLYNMLGNAAEWTASSYTPPARTGVTKKAEGQIPYSVVRGGSWNDTASLASLPSRWRYMPFQGVQDVGFRVVAHPR